MMIDEDKIIRDFSGNTYSKEEFLREVKKYNDDGYDFFIGTDSQVFNEHISMVTAICPRLIIEDTGRSSRLFYIKEKLSRKACRNLRTRMLMEAYRSIETAMELDDIISRRISIHLDIGASLKSETRHYQKELQYLVVAQGYDCEIKPNSWAAGGVADRFSKS
jgi:predicted RNase H-related nuclease YkuK (DUF458 family)